MTMLIVSATLAAVIAVGWSRILKFEVLRLDERLCMEVRRIASQPEHGQDMSRLENDLMAKLRLTSPDQLMLRLEFTAAESRFQSGNWDKSIDINSLNWQAVARSDRSRPTNAPPRDQGSGAEPPRPRDNPRQEECQVASFSARDKQWRAALMGRNSERSAVAADLAAIEQELQSAYNSALKFVLPLALLLTALGAWALSIVTMRPVNQLRNAMKGVTQKALDQRLAMSGQDREFKELITAYNTMLERLELSFRQASRFSADAAHELKTPLTILLGRIEQAVSRSDGDAIQADLTDMLDEVGRLSTITHKLLLLSQADAGRLALHLTRVDLTKLLDELMVDTQMLVTNQTVSAVIERSLVIQGDALLLRQLFNNLISNAARYCLQGGWIEVRSHKLPGGIEVIFANVTPNITAEDRARFFERFFRGDAAHNRHIEGNGLGLSLAREIARAHEGDLTLEPSLTNEVRLRLWLPHP
jgi:two-component system, OmpR family, heavy metal sensor histidine kinase CusS